MSRLLRKPEGRTLYWAYAYDEDENQYNFDTSTRLAEAKKMAREMIREGWHHVYIFHGDEDGAFTWLDPAWQTWPRGRGD